MQIFINTKCRKSIYLYIGYIYKRTLINARKETTENTEEYYRSSHYVSINIYTNTHESAHSAPETNVS